LSISTDPQLNPTRRPEGAISRNGNSKTFCEVQEWLLHKVGMMLDLQHRWGDASIAHYVQEERPVEVAMEMMSGEFYAKVELGLPYADVLCKTLVHQLFHCLPGSLNWSAIYPRGELWQIFAILNHQARPFFHHLQTTLTGTDD
jgi:hypothetical protein